MEALIGESTKMVRENGVYVCVPERFLGRPTNHEELNNGIIQC